jgi:hypothetical protein
MRIRYALLSLSFSLPILAFAQRTPPGISADKYLYGRNSPVKVL